MEDAGVSLLRCCRGFSCLCFANLCRKSMWEGAWAAAPRGIPACLGKHSCQAPSALPPAHPHPGPGGSCPCSSHPTHLRLPGWGGHGAGLGSTSSSPTTLCCAVPGGRAGPAVMGPNWAGGYRACGVPGQQTQILTVASAAWDVPLLSLTCWQCCGTGRVGSCWGRVGPDSCFRLKGQDYMLIVDMKTWVPSIGRTWKVGASP